MEARYLTPMYREGSRPARRVPEELRGTPINNNDSIYKVILPDLMKGVFMQELSSDMVEQLCEANVGDKAEYLEICVDLGMKMLERICNLHDALNELLTVSHCFVFFYI